jgi:hypothetical protein
VVELVGRRHSRVTYCLSQLGQFSIFNLLEMKTKYPYHVASLPFYLLVFFVAFKFQCRCMFVWQKRYCRRLFLLFPISFQRRCMQVFFIDPHFPPSFLPNFCTFFSWVGATALYFVFYLKNVVDLKTRRTRWIFSSIHIRLPPAPSISHLP